MARPWAMPKRAPTAWASAWLTPTKALENASPAIVAALAIAVRASRSSPSRVGARERVEDQVRGLQAEGVGEGRGEDRDAGLQRVRQRVDAGVRGDLGRQGQGQARVDDGHVRDERVVHERQLAVALR